MANFVDVKNNKTLGVFALVMMNLIAVGSLRSLSLAAIYGFSLVFFYLIATIVFFIPSILVTAKLSTAFPSMGGPYIWIREAFGARWGFWAVWLQWIYNVVWYPTIFSMMAAILAYLVDPQLVNNKIYLLPAMLIMFWGVTIINCRGIKASSLLSTICALLGTLLPMICIITLGIIWLLSGKPSQISFSMEHFFPSKDHLNNLAFLSTLVFGLMGMEMTGVHAGDVKNPKQDYPRALRYSGIIILITLMLGALSIAIVVPIDQLNLASGVIDAFQIFFNAFHLSFLTPLFAGLIVIGGLGCASTWIMGTARGMSIASHDNALPAILRKMNGNNMPIGILLLQGLIFTLLCSLFLLMPTINASFWILSNLTAQLALLFYLMLFTAAIRLQLKPCNKERIDKIPGGKFSLNILSGLGILSCLTIFVLGFLPSTQVPTQHVLIYEMMLMGGILFFIGLPIIFTKRS
ncbi:MAG: putative glutamate/gamma-aminobutyrate antiporter [Legionellaceae bacterium]